MVTKIEKFEYLDMDDPKNSWYFDAERFDVNFPLACSYRGYRVFKDLYDYFNVVSEYYRSQENIHVLIVESKYPHELANYYFDKRKLVEYSVPPTNPEFEIIEREGKPYFLAEDISVGRFFFPERKFMFSLTERIGNLLYTRFLFCTKFDGSAEELRSEFFTSPSWGFPNRGFPYLQTITTQDWDLIKRYFFFMIRNHQYKYANLMYFEDKSIPITDRPIFFTDGDAIDSLFSGLLENARVEGKLIDRQVVHRETITEFDRTFAEPALL